MSDKAELDNLRNVPLLDLTQTWSCPDCGDALRLTKTQLRLLAQAEHDKEAKHEND